MYIEQIKKYTPKNDLEAMEKKIVLDYIKDYPNTVLTRDNKIAHICVSGFILNKAMDKTLMIHHNIYKSWGWTGGHADGNSDLRAVALKEAREETGVTDFTPISTEIASLDILPVPPHIKNGKPVNAHLHLTITYLLMAKEDAELTIKPDENSGVAWLPVTDLKDYCIEPIMLPIYEKLVARAKGLSR